MADEEVKAVIDIYESVVKEAVDVAERFNDGSGNDGVTLLRRQEAERNDTSTSADAATPSNTATEQESEEVEDREVERIPTPALTLRDWPRNQHPDPGPEPTLYDLWAGQDVPDDQCIPYTRQIEKGLSKISTVEDIVTLIADDECTPYAKQIGKGLPRVPMGHTIPHPIDDPIGLPDVTHQRRLLLDYPSEIQLLPFSIKCCPLCKAPRYRGKSVYHDFRLLGEDGLKIHTDKWPDHFGEAVGAKEEDEDTKRKGGKRVIDPPTNDKGKKANKNWNAGLAI
ncbi:hypothetical protein M3J09_008110 [Ascochyta lentis]